MRRLLGSSLLVGAAAVGAIALSAPAAFASTWTVNNSNADGHFAATLKSGTTVAFKDVTTNQPFTCTASSVFGTAKSGTYSSGVGIATLNSGSFSGCTGNFGAHGTAALSNSILNADSYASPTTTGHITNVSASLAITDLFGTCNATVTGTIAKGTYTNGTGAIVIFQDPSTSAGLTVVTATGGGCAGLINVGDKAVFGATYLGTDPSPPITITSP